MQLFLRKTILTLLTSIAILGLSCCTTNKAIISNDDAIFYVRWQLVEYVDTDKDTVEPAFEKLEDSHSHWHTNKICWIVLSTDTLSNFRTSATKLAKVYRGHGTSNKFEGYYKINTMKKEIQFITCISTEAGCMGECMKVEKRFIESFTHSTRYKHEGDKLTLYYDDGKKYMILRKMN